MNRSQPKRAIRFTAPPAAPVVIPPPAAAAIQAERLRLARQKRERKAAQARSVPHAT